MAAAAEGRSSSRTRSVTDHSTLILISCSTTHQNRSAVVLCEAVVDHSISWASSRCSWNAR